MKAYRIISFDGGGVRGMYTAQLLSMLFKEVDFLKHVDLFAGTSTGSFIALGLAFHFTPEHLVSFYEQFAPAIFVPNNGYDEKMLNKAKYSNQFLKSSMLEHVFPGNPTLADLPKKVVIPACKLNQSSGWGPMSFHNFDHKEAKKNHVIDVALASGAAPLYFPSYQGSIDGGVFANNPSMEALCLVLEKQDITIDQVKIFSIGTGELPDCILQDVDWGVKKWLNPNRLQENLPDFPLFSLMTQSNAKATTSQCSSLLKSNFYRLNAALDRSISLDNWMDIGYLKQKAIELPREHPILWKQAIEWLKEHFHG